MKPTPETERRYKLAIYELPYDTNYRANYQVWKTVKILKEHMERFERERDEAREQRDRLADLVKQFIHILDITEESDSGRLFHPTNITSCRAGDLQKAGELVEALRRAVKGGSDE